MSGLKAIRRRITSVKNTKQITRAMKLVSAAKLRRAQDAALSGRRYRDELNDILRRIIAELPQDFSHPLLERRTEIKKRRAIVIGGSRGLCGAYNANVAKAVQLNEESALASDSVSVTPIGKQAGIAGKRFGWPLSTFAEELDDDAALWPVTILAEKLVAEYIAGEFDELVVYYTKFVSAMTQEVTRTVILPFTPDQAATLVPEQDAALKAAEVHATRFDPEPLVMLTKLLPVLIGSHIRQAGLEAKASEHAARMTAMDSATRNADDLIGQLKLFYNRARQTAITRELIDIVGGAEAIK